MSQLLPETSIKITREGREMVNEILDEVVANPDDAAHAIIALRSKVELLMLRLGHRGFPAETNGLLKCARCQEIKETVFVDTGFSGEKEPLCGQCISIELSHD